MIKTEDKTRTNTCIIYKKQTNVTTEHKTNNKQTNKQSFHHFFFSFFLHDHLEAGASFSVALTHFAMVCAMGENEKKIKKQLKKNPGDNTSTNITNNIKIKLKPKNKKKKKNHHHHRETHQRGAADGIGHVKVLEGEQGGRERRGGHVGLCRLGQRGGHLGEVCGLQHVVARQRGRQLRQAATQRVQVVVRQRLARHLGQRPDDLPVLARLARERHCAASCLRAALCVWGGWG